MNWARRDATRQLCRVGSSRVGWCELGRTRSSPERPSCQATESFSARRQQQLSVTIRTPLFDVDRSHVYARDRNPTDGEGTAADRDQLGSSRRRRGRSGPARNVPFVTATGPRARAPAELPILSLLHVSADSARHGRDRTLAPFTEVRLSGQDWGHYAPLRPWLKLEGESVGMVLHFSSPIAPSFPISSLSSLALPSRPSSPTFL